MSVHLFSSLLFSLYGLSSREVRTCRMQGLLVLCLSSRWCATAMCLYTPSSCHRMSKARPMGVPPPPRAWWRVVGTHSSLFRGLHIVGGGCLGILLISPECAVRQLELLVWTRNAGPPQPHRGPSGDHVGRGRERGIQVRCPNTSRLLFMRSGYQERQE